MKKIYSNCISATFIIALTGGFFGCSKSDLPAKEVAKPVAQKEAPAAKVMAPTSTVAEFVFKKDTQKWSPQKGVTISENTTQTHGGQGSLEISGTSGPENLDFGGSPKFKVVAGKHYKFSGWMNIEAYDANKGHKMCWLKVHIFNDNKWMRSINGSKYDFAKIGTWQLLSGEFDAPADGNLTASFVVDKRPKDQDVSATLYLDELQIELTH